MISVIIITNNNDKKDIAINRMGKYGKCEWTGGKE